MMIEGTRRSFLGGMISLIAAQTFVAKAADIGNMPCIKGDGRHDDAYGFGSLLRNEVVIFPKEKIGVSSHGGIIIHGGAFLIGTEVLVPDNASIMIEAAEFKSWKYDGPFKEGEDWPKRVQVLPENAAYFCIPSSLAKQFCGLARTFSDHPRFLRERNGNNLTQDMADFRATEPTYVRCVTCGRKMSAFGKPVPTPLYCTNGCNPEWVAKQEVA
jgi:hypothetical protein